MFRTAGLIGYVYVGVIIIWIVITALYQGFFYPPHQIESTGDILAYYYNKAPGYYGLDHGSKSIVFLLSILIPMSLYHLFRSRRNTKLINQIGFIFGLLHFLLLSVSFMIQGITAEYAISLYGSSNEKFNKYFATNLFDWALEGGGLSLSIYIISNLSLFIWVSCHSFLILKCLKNYSVYLIGVITAVLALLSAIVVFIGLIFINVNLNLLSEISNLTFLIWIICISNILLKTNSKRAPNFIDR